MKFDTIREATEIWVRTFNAIPQGMISELMKNNITDWYEITKPSVGDRVYVYENGESGEIIDKNENGYLIELDNDEEIQIEDENDFEIDRYDLLPMWGTMWSFGESIDDWWLEKNLDKMSQCGFRIFQSDTYGYFFGIDGAGYDFYEAHWIPLYKARGMQWHETEDKN